MPRLEEVYLSKEKLPDLEKEFYKSYDESYWKVKIGMYDHLIENMEDIFEDSNVEEIGDYQRMTKAEFVYMFYHSTEALLGLVRSLTKDGIPWIDLKEARGWKIDEFVEGDLQSDDFDEDLMDVIYPAAEFENSDQEEQIKESVEVIWDYLVRIGTMFGDRGIYNEYKHGLRLITSESRIEIEFTPGERFDEEDISELSEIDETEDGLVWTALSGDILFYLDSSIFHQDENSGKKFWSLSRKMQSLEFELYRRLCNLNADLISQIFSVRRKSIGISEDDREKVRIILWDDLDLEEFLKPENSLQNFSVDLYHPDGEEDLLVYEIT